MSIGSAIALVVPALASLGFFFYVANFGHDNKTYGSIGGMIVLLLWLWIANLSLLFGAEFDAEMARTRAAGRHQGARRASSCRPAMTVRARRPQRRRRRTSPVGGLS